MKFGNLGVKRGKLPTVLLLVYLIILSGCAFSQEDPVNSEVAVLPPAQTVPASGPAPTDVFMVELVPTVPEAPTLDISQIPTAIARGIEAAFSTAEPTVAPIPSSTASPVPTSTPTPCGAAGQIVTGTYPSESAGLSPYRIYLPPCYGDEERVYPTLYMLPGNIHTDGIWDSLGLDEAAEAAIKRGEIPPLLIVMAAGGTLLNYTSGGPFSYESQILEDLIPFIESNYCAWQDPAGRAIGGVSRGGYWSLEIAFRHPDQFVSVGGHSASLYDYYGGPDVVPQSTGLANDLGDLRIYFDIGEYDPLIYNIQKLHEDMEEAGIEHVWILNEGAHTNTYWSSHTEEYIAWYSEPWTTQRDAYPLCNLETSNLSD